MINGVQDDTSGTHAERAVGSWSVRLGGICWCLWLLTGCQSVPSFRGQSPAWESEEDRPLRSTQDDRGVAPRKPRKESLRPRRIDEEPLPEEESVPEDIDEGLRLSDDATELTDPIANIAIEGNDTIETAAIRQLIRTAIGRPPVEQQIREDVRALYSTRWFFSVEPRYRRTDKGLILVFRVIERPIVEQVEYRGNDKIKTKHLEKLTGLREGSPFDVSANREAVRRIEEHYKSKGFPYTKVNLLRGNDRQDRSVVFEIDEGPKVIVGAVKFIGNSGVSEGDLQEQVATKLSFTGGLLKTKLSLKPAFLGIGLFGKYKPEQIPEDLAAIKAYYHSLGYFDVSIDKAVEIDERPWNPLSFGAAHAIITYRIDEGRRFQVRNVVIEGNAIYSLEELSADLKLRSGDYYNARLMTKDVQGIQDRYGKLGRTFAKCEPIPRFLEESGHMDLVYQIDEDQVYKIRKVEVQINGDHPHTKEHVVLNRILVHPGDLADPKLIDRSTRRLQGQIFERVGPEAPRVQVAKVEEKPKASRTPIMQAGGVRGQSPEARGQSPETASTPEFDPSTSLLFAQSDPYSAPLGGGATDPLIFQPPQSQLDLQDPRQLDLLYQATETQTGRLSFGVGVNSNSGAVGSIVLEENNFDILRPPTSFDDIRNGTAWRGGGQQFRIEAVPGNVVSRYLVSWTDPYFLDTDYSLGTSFFFFNRFYRDWQEDRLGGRISLGRQLTNEFSVMGALRLESIDLSNPRVNPPPAILARSLGDSFLTTGRISAAYDTRDSQFIPSEGIYVNAGYEHAFGDFQYPRAEGEAHRYFTVFSRPDGGGRHILSVGASASWTGPDTPIFERYFAGGFQSMRGFSYRGVSPVDTGVRVGGQWMFLGGAEYYIPLTADEMIGAVAFCDAGTVESSKVGFDNFRVTVGGGLRLTIPMMGPAPIALDWGIPIINQDFDDTRIFSFSVGFAR